MLRSVLRLLIPIIVASALLFSGTSRATERENLVQEMLRLYRSGKNALTDYLRGREQRIE